jgi:hypothetical protein
VIGGSIIVACSFSSHVPGMDQPIDALVPDAGPCKEAPTFECAGDKLRACMTVGSDPAELACNWGCVPDATHHCGRVAPAGDVATETDMRPEMFAGVGDVTITASNAKLDGTAGTITGVTSGQFTRTLKGTKALFRFKSLTVNANLKIVGDGSIVLIADGPITINAILDAKGPCVGMNNDNAAQPGPGGYAGATGSGANATGPGAGVGGTNTSGAGGGGNGGSGGSGGAGGAGAAGNSGPAIGMSFAVLEGGGGGGASEGAGGRGRGGGGGGAVQLISNTKIVLNSGGIDVGGCGGDSGQGNGQDGGGGGGAGGTIILEAPVIEGGATLAANGGGGGAGSNSSSETGQPGQFNRTLALGGLSVNGNGAGGDGGAGATARGENGQSDNHAGGGGGGIGRIHLRTKSGNFSAASTTWSPARNEPGFSNGSATVH